jgi:hypothetical protein
MIARQTELLGRYATARILYMELHLGRHPLTGNGDCAALWHGV